MSVQIKRLEYHGIRDSRFGSKRQATPYRLSGEEQISRRPNCRLYHEDRKIPVESKLPKVHCLVMEDERWDHASNGNNSTDNGEEMIDESVPYAATGPGFHVLGANPDPSLLRIERNLSEIGDDRGL